MRFCGKTASMEIVLASGSKYKKELFERLGLPFTVAESALDESRWKIPGRDAGSIARELAVAKASEVLKRFPDAVVIGADQVAEIDGTLLDKPITVPNAIEQLTRLSGKTHLLHTAISVRSQGHAREHLEVSKLAVRPLSKEQIERYVAQELPLDCAGSYRFEERGIRLFGAVQTADPTAIVGLPLIALTTILSEFGFGVP